MSGDLPAVRVGQATVHFLHVGLLHVELASWLRVPEFDWTAETAPLFAQPLVMPALCALIELPSTLILVDACDPQSIVGGEYDPPGVQQPSDLTTQLAALGRTPESVEHVVLTHLHFDHFSGVTREQDGKFVPCFPRARHYIGCADWIGIADDLHNPALLENRTLAVIERHGLLELVDDRAELGGGVSILAAPGETPGHQIVRVQSAGQVLYCLGDLFHHTIEVARPDWLVYWADALTTDHSRRQLVSAALGENALLMAAHIPALGRLRPTPAGVRWDAA